jgi:hypothetical protein
LKRHILLGLQFALLGASLVSAQETPLGAEWRRETERISDACGTFSFGAAASCAYTLFTDHPFHIAAGSLPPQNGFGFGGAFVWTKNTKNWRLSWDVDATGAPSAAWRAGGYMTMVHTPHKAKPPIKVLTPHPEGTPPEESKAQGAGAGDETKEKSESSFVHPYTVFNFYAQTISLNKLYFFGLGNDSSVEGKSIYGMNQTIVGASAIKPIFEWGAIRKLNLALLGELNGRFVDLRPEHGQSVPSIETLYNDATAPGLSNQPGFAQLGEGVRIKPAIGNFELNYVAKFQQYFAPSDSHSSFLRWTVDLNHTYDLHGYTQPSAHAGTLGPDSCAPSFDDCPKIPRTLNVSGSLGVRLFVSESINSASSAVPFYFQQTLGGQDINSALSLGSYQDYRFRAPNVLLLQESFEHSIWGPFGFKFTADQGRVAVTRGDLGFSHLKHSFATGLTLRAGAFPMVSLLFAWGGAEGQHTIANMNTSLLGGSARPPLD